MAASVNRVILLGRLGKDPEQRFTSSGVAFTHFSLATDETWKDSGGKKRERVEWHNIITWRKLADICAQYLSKGRLVYLEGRLQTRCCRCLRRSRHPVLTETVSRAVVSGRDDAMSSPPFNDSASLSGRPGRLFFGFGRQPPCPENRQRRRSSALVRFGHAVADLALVKDVGGFGCIVAQLAPELLDDAA